MSNQPKQQSPGANIPLTIIIFLIIAIGTYFGLSQLTGNPKIAYVDTGKLMVGFSEANKVDREIKAEDDKWREQLKIIQDSVQASMDTMSKYFDSSTPAQKKAYQDNLSAWNQRANNFKQANLKRMADLRNEKMQTVIEKINIYIGEYGREHSYSIILGTAVGGTILYGNTNENDLTEKMIKGLNERYK